MLLQGETGTGKELVARLLHRASRRAAGPFEAVDCSAIPRELIESELFGHVRGAFTGAARDYAGAFERADGGTLLLDEIGDMDLASQTRLLRVLQERSVRRVGADRAVPVDVRVVAASNRDLGELVQSGRFREDLYYRIHVCLLQLPPLRERGDDRLVLFDAFMRQSAAARTRPRRSRCRRGGACAARASGNVRQLQNVARQLLVGGAGARPDRGRRDGSGSLRRAAGSAERLRRAAAPPIDRAESVRTAALATRAPFPDAAPGLGGRRAGARARGRGAGAAQSRRRDRRHRDVGHRTGWRSIASTRSPPPAPCRSGAAAVATRRRAGARSRRPRLLPVRRRFFHRLVQSEFAFDSVASRIWLANVCGPGCGARRAAFDRATEADPATIARLAAAAGGLSFDLEATRAPCGLAEWSLPAV